MEEKIIKTSHRWYDECCIGCNANYDFNIGSFKVHTYWQGCNNSNCSCHKFKESLE